MKTGWIVAGKKLRYYADNKGKLLRDEPKKIDVAIDIVDVGEGVRISFLEKKLIAPHKEVSIFFNPSNNDIPLSFPQPVSVLFGVNGEADKHKHAEWTLPRHSVVIVGN